MTLALLDISKEHSLEGDKHKMNSVIYIGREEGLGIPDSEFTQDIQNLSLKDLEMLHEIVVHLIAVEDSAQEGGR